MHNTNGDKTSANFLIILFLCPSDSLCSNTKERKKLIQACTRSVIKTVFPSEVIGKHANP